MIAQFLRALTRRAMPLLGTSIFAGLAFPPLAAATRPLLEASVVGLLTAMLVRLDWPAMGRYARRPVLVGVAVAWQLAITPLLVWGVAAALALPAALTVALVLNAAAPALMSAPAFAQILRLDAPLAVVVVVATTILMPFTLAPLALWGLGLDFALGPAAFALRLTLFIIVPFALAGMIRRVAGPARLAARDAEIGGLTILMIVVFAVAIMDGVAARTLAEPVVVLTFVAAAFAVNIALQIIGGLIFAPLGRPAALAMALVSGNRNMGLVLVTTTGLAGPDFALYVAAAQLPIYLIAPLAAPIYRRLSRL